MSESGTDCVECYSGHTYAQEPRVVVWQGRRFPVTQIERRWRTPDGPAFLVEAEADARFELHYAEAEDTWTIQAVVDSNSEAPKPADQDGDGSEGSNRETGNSKPLAA